MEGDFKDICLFIIHKISPGPSFPKRGIMGLDQKTIYKQTLFKPTSCKTVYAFMIPESFRDIICYATFR
jgi:hypothetical protein